MFTYILSEFYVVFLPRAKPLIGGSMCGNVGRLLSQKYDFCEIIIPCHILNIWAITLLHESNKRSQCGKFLL